MRFDRKKFFDGVKDRIDATLNQEQVDGLEFLLDGFERDSHWKNIQHIAYALATVFHETAASFQPVEEGYYLGSKAKAFQKKLRYYPFFGRGYVQLTWDSNYEKAGDALGVDLKGNPDLALDPLIAFKVLTEGLFRGWFGGKLTTYINDTKTDYVNARRCVNILDKAGLIAGYAKSFEKILKASQQQNPFQDLRDEEVILDLSDRNTRPAASTANTLENPLGLNPPDPVAPTNELDTTKVIESHETPTGSTMTVSETSNVQDVNTPAAVSTTTYQGIGLIGVLKKDFAVVTGGNLSFQGIQEYATQASGWPPWVISIITKLATVAAIAGIGWLLFRLFHYIIWKIGDTARMKVEANINSDVTRKNIEWT